MSGGAEGFDAGEGWMPMRDAEPGVHETRDGWLLFKSEYSTMNKADGAYQVDAYMLTSGEYWWGGHKTVRDRDAKLVRPVDVHALLGRGVPGR